MGNWTKKKKKSIKCDGEQLKQNKEGGGEATGSRNVQTEREQCTRAGVDTGSLGLETTLALLLIWRDRVTSRDGQTDGQKHTDR